MERRRPHHRSPQDQARSLIQRGIRNAERGNLAVSVAGLFFRVPRSNFRVQMVRLQKFLADAGIASRRASEQFILEGRVEVNGQTVRQLGTKIDPLHDRVTVNGKLVRAKRKLYVALNKPRGCVCSRKDEFKRPTIYE